MDQSPSRVRQLESDVRRLKILLTEVECKYDATWKEKVAEFRRAEAEEALANLSLSTMSDPQRPFLVNINHKLTSHLKLHLRALVITIS